MTGDMTPRDLLEDEAVAAYVDGEMEPAARARFEARLAVDPALSRHVEEYRATLDLLRAERVAAPPVPEEFLHAVQRRIRQKSRGRFYSRPRFRFPVETVTILAAILVMLYVGLDVFFPGRSAVTVIASRRVALTAPLPAQTARSLGMEEIALGDGVGVAWTVSLRRDNLPAVREVLLPLLGEEDRGWLGELGLDEGQEVRLSLFPPGMELVPVRLELRAPDAVGGDAP